MNVLSWFRSNWGVYADNAASRRDYRVQLRGNRSVWLFAVYLGLLSLIAMVVYGEASASAHSVVEAQFELNNFYNVVMSLLAAMICLVAPALTATAVVSERQRQSLDLVFSAPTTPKYYLVGKMLASLRFTWMLLILAVPVTATCVVLGGANWTDVLVAYILLSGSTLILTSLALLMSTIAKRPISALVYSYGLVFVYLFVSSIGGASAFFMRGGVHEVFFGVALSPFAAAFAGSTYTDILGHHVPNWVLVILFSLAMCRITLLAAGSILAPYGGKEVVSLRIHGIVYVTLLALYVAYLSAPSMMRTFAASASPAPSTPSMDVIYGIGMFWSLSYLVILVPIFSCFGFDAERRYWPNGVFRVRDAFYGRPAGALPYLLMLIGGLALGLFVGAYWATGLLLGRSFFAYFTYTLGFWVFFWGVARYASSRFNSLRSARALQFAVFAILVMLPAPFLSAIASLSGQIPGSDVWDFYILRPLFTTSDDQFGIAFCVGVGLLVLAAILAYLAEKRVSQRSVPGVLNHVRADPAT